MGWASGSAIYGVVAGALADGASNERLLKDLIYYLEQEDCDTLDECFGISEVSDNILIKAGYHNWNEEVCGREDDESEVCACGFKY